MKIMNKVKKMKIKELHLKNLQIYYIYQENKKDEKCMERIEKYNFVKYRRLKNLSIIELASKMKMSANKVMMIEKHPKKITRFNLLRLSKVLNVSAEELIYENKGKVLNAEDLTPNQIQMVVLLYRSFREEN